MLCSCGPIEKNPLQLLTLFNSIAMVRNVVLELDYRVQQVSSQLEAKKVAEM